jgi:DNA mismatch endonuclease, patch repair protein
MHLIPSPPATDDATRRRMQATRSKHSRAERELRSELHRRGLRYRLHLPLLDNKRYKADIVFLRARVVVFLDGCFWHSCPEHGTRSISNAGWWANKLARNRERDAFAESSLVDRGWTVVRVWEHEDPRRAADAIEDVLCSPGSPRVVRV